MALRWHWLRATLVWLGIQMAVSPFVLATEWDTIRDRGYLVIAVKDNRRPLGYRDAQGELVGYEIDLARQLAQDLLGSPDAVQFRPVQNPERLTLVANGAVDMAIAGIGITPMRQRIVHFSQPYYWDGTAFVTRRPDIRTMADLRQRAIALIPGSEAVAAVAFWLPQAQRVRVAGYQAAWQALEAGAADGFAGDLSILAGWVQSYPQYHLLPERISTTALAIALPKGVAAAPLQQRVDGAIRQWQASGWLQERAIAWGLPSGEPDPVAR